MFYNQPWPLIVHKIFLLYLVHKNLLVHCSSQNRSILINVFSYSLFGYDALCLLLRHSKNIRFWFAHNVLFTVLNHFSEYLLECLTAEVRGAFAKLIVFIAHFSLQDGPCPSCFTSLGPASQVIENFPKIMKYNGLLFSSRSKSVNMCIFLTYLLYMNACIHYWIH